MQFSRLDLSDDKLSDNVTFAGRPFDLFAAVMGNAWSPMVWSSVHSTVSAEVNNECKGCQAGNSKTSCKALLK